MLISSRFRVYKQFGGVIVIIKYIAGVVEKGPITIDG
jgi:hypothetical protein